MCSPRVIADGQRIHESAFDVHEQTPAVTLPQGYIWTSKAKKKVETRSTGPLVEIALDWTKAALQKEGLLEKDPYASIGVIIDELQRGMLSAENRNVLDTLRSSGWWRLQIVPKSC
jgi:hypothetical protein